MATPKKNSYITAELDWAEEQLKSWKAYIDANPIHELKERMVWKETKGGGAMPIVSETIGQQIKTLSDLMTRYLALLEIVDKQRESEQKKLEVRGDSEVNGMMSRMKNNQ